MRAVPSRPQDLSRTLLLDTHGNDSGTDQGRPNSNSSGHDTVVPERHQRHLLAGIAILAVLALGRAGS